MKNAKDIIEYLEAERIKAFEMHSYWKDISPSEAQKHIIRATTIEGILDDIAPFEEQLTKEEPAQAVPQEKKHGNSFLETYLNIYSIVVLVSSCVACGLLISGLLDKWGVTMDVYSLLLFCFGVLHICSFGLMLSHSHLLIMNRKK